MSPASRVWVVIDGCRRFLGKVPVQSQGSECGWGALQVHGEVVSKLEAAGYTITLAAFIWYNHERQLATNKPSLLPYKSPARCFTISSCSSLLLRPLCCGCDRGRRCWPLTPLLPCLCPHFLGASRPQKHGNSATFIDNQRHGSPSKRGTPIARRRVYSGQRDWRSRLYCQLLHAGDELMPHADCREEGRAVAHQDARHMMHQDARRTSAAHRLIIGSSSAHHRLIIGSSSAAHRLHHRLRIGSRSPRGMAQTLAALATGQPPRPFARCARVYTKFIHTLTSTTRSLLHILCHSMLQIGHDMFKILYHIGLLDTYSQIFRTFMFRAQIWARPLKRGDHPRHDPPLPLRSTAPSPTPLPPSSHPPITLGAAHGSRKPAIIHSRVPLARCQLSRLSRSSPVHPSTYPNSPELSSSPARAQNTLRPSKPLTWA